MLVDETLANLQRDFERMYADGGRESIPPERLLKAMVLMALYSVRSERQFCEQLQFNLLWRWFLDMGFDEQAWDASTFSRNRERLLGQDIARLFFEETVEIAKSKRLLSQRHFTVDGTLIEAWASLKSFQPKDAKKRRDRKDKDDDSDPGNPSVNFHGEKRSNETHTSTTDPEARLMRKGNTVPAKLCYTGNFLMENRNGLIVDLNIEQATGRSEREGALKLIERARKRRRGRMRIESLGADKGYHSRDFVAALREREITPHVAVIERNLGSTRDLLDGRTLSSMSYKISQRIRKRVEELIGWSKQTGGLRRTRFKGRRRTEQWALMIGAAYNLLRIPRLEEAPSS
jgi:transposase